MITGLSTASMFGSGLLEENLREIGKHGIRHVEVFLNTFSEYEPAYARQLRQIADDFGICIHSVHPHGVQFEPQLFYGYDRTVNDAFGMFEKVLAAAKLLGAKAYIFHGGLFYKPAPQHQHNFERIGQVLDRAVELAAQYDIVLAYENVHWCWFCSPDFGERILEHVHSKKLAFTLDIKQAAQSGIDPLQYLKMMQGRLANVHICDFIHEPNGLRTCLPFHGEMDFYALKKALLEAGYQGPVMLEVYRNDYADEQELLGCYCQVEKFFTAPLGDTF